jgi:hypothetical protein
MTAPPSPPPGLRTSGRALWTSIVRRLELETHETLVLTEACRIADRLDALNAAIFTAGGLDHQLLVESRHQQITLTRLIASLRLPDDLSDPSKGSRKQQRNRPRGTYHEERKSPA